MTTPLEELKQRLTETYDLYLINNVLQWDQATYMPSGGAASRGRHQALMSRLAHERMTDPAIGRLLDTLQSYGESLPFDHDDAAYLRAARRSFERATRVPSALVAELSEHGAKTYDEWTRARPDNDFARVQPLLEKTLDLSRRYADCFPGYEHIIDPLIDYSDYGMKATTVRAIFADLRAQIVPLVTQLAASQPIDDSVLKRLYPEAAQEAFGVSIIRDYGYDFDRGRQDRTHHPFMIPLNGGDVRITTRFNDHDLGDGLFGTLHEAGHGMYEQGVSRAYESSPLSGGTSGGVHESQSRLWENIVGRSRGFWQHYYPALQAAFPGTLEDTSPEAFYRAINKVTPSLIRVDADEVTYNLHVMIRFDLEMALLEGSLAIKDLPEAWDARYGSDLGVEPPDDRNGVLQDVHWFGGAIGGAFQSYTLGNLLSAQFYEAALAANPSIPDEIARGEFGTLRMWLTENIYQHGSKFTASELIKRVMGGGIDSAPLVRYLRSKYGDLYGLS